MEMACACGQQEQRDGSRQPGRMQQRTEWLRRVARQGRCPGIDRQSERATGKQDQAWPHGAVHRFPRLVAVNPCYTYSSAEIVYDTQRIRGSKRADARTIGPEGTQYGT